MVYGTKDPCSKSADALKRQRNNGLEMEMRKLILGAAAAAMIAGSSVAQAAPMEKRLSRLEQLRLERQKAAEAKK